KENEMIKLIEFYILNRYLEEQSSMDLHVFTFVGSIAKLPLRKLNKKRKKNEAFRPFGLLTKRVTRDNRASNSPTITLAIASSKPFFSVLFFFSTTGDSPPNKYLYPTTVKKTFFFLAGFYWKNIGNLFGEHQQIKPRT
ncbi:hypothetical protein PanWU01x14_298060, partial [Parasponia andersonii]